jgi:acyl-CoA thioester hydrolase
VGLFREDANIAAAQGYFVHVHVDRETRKPVPMTGDVRAILEHLAQG